MSTLHLEIFNQRRGYAQRLKPIFRKRVVRGAFGKMPLGFLDFVNHGRDGSEGVGQIFWFEDLRGFGHNHSMVTLFSSSEKSHLNPYIQRYLLRYSETNKEIFEMVPT